MVAYDIDKFRGFVFKTPFLEIYEIPEERGGRVLQESDVELLRFGYKYLKLVLLLEERVADEGRDEGFAGSGGLG